MSPELRVIAGKFKGRKLTSSAGDYRPTSAIVKKSLFDILNVDIEDAIFLDLFAGCGAVGIEAISRGAAFVSFVENDFSRIQILNKNLKSLDISEDFFEIIPSDFTASLSRLAVLGRKYEYVYIDPPYQAYKARRILSETADSGMLDEESLIIFESGKLEVRDILSEMPKTLYPVREKIHGSTAMIFFRLSTKYADPHA